MTDDVIKRYGEEEVYSVTPKNEERCRKVTRQQETVKNLK